MEVVQLPLEGSGFRSKLLNDYLKGDDFLKQFYAFSPSLDSFREVIESRKKFPVNRTLLVQELLQQHKDFLARFPNVSSNIKELENNSTFTVTTGHQLCLAGGPLFFIYKILTVINLAVELNKRFPDCKFVPVYWMATEDHDFEEIAGLNVNGAEVKWNHLLAGATGRMDLQGLEEFFVTAEKSIAGFPGSDRLKQIFHSAYASGRTLAEATRTFVLDFFGEDGLLVLDADVPAFKKEFSNILKDELIHESSFAAVNAADKVLNTRYSMQVKPREINLFYLSENFRSRIVRSGNTFEVLNSNLKFSQEEILSEVEHHPERFSPNVILRPVYQEVLLPNLAYIGGPAETAYWLQFKQVFDHHQVFYPVLVPRNHAVIIESKPWKHWSKLRLGHSELFIDCEKLITDVVKKVSGEESVTASAMIQLKEVYASILEQAAKTDVTLKPAVEAQLKKSMKGLDRIEKKHFSALKRKHELVIRHIREMMDVVKPDGIPQERVMSFFTLYAAHGDSILDALKKEIIPFSDTFTVIHT